MCGIVGYIGKQQAAPILLKSLERLEYRGYDSAGIAIKSEGIVIYKSKGKLDLLNRKINCGNDIKGSIGIGHTRWATHGIANTTNAHPHSSDKENTVVLVHNGIIENHFLLKQQLQDCGYEFYSETDSEVIAKIIYSYLQVENDPVKAIIRFIDAVQGTYALAVLFKDYGDAIYVICKDSPAIVGMNDMGAYLASDLQAILPHTHEVFFLDNTEIAKVEANRICFFDRNLKEIKKEKIYVDFNYQMADKGKYEHFMLKEIFEQPKAIKETYDSIINEIQQVFDKMRKQITTFQTLDCIYIVACGSAFNAGLVLRSIIEKICTIQVNVEVASEFRYKALRRSNFNSLVVIISQSGETADSIASLRKAKELKYITLAIVNVLGSVIDLEADYVLHTKAGQEVAVATTKAYSAQLIAGYILCVRLALEMQTISFSRYLKYLEEIKLISDRVVDVLKYVDAIKQLASLYLSKQNNIFIVGRDVDYVICKEGALKFKEVSYLFAEAYVAGEFKHGAISIIEEGMVVIGVLTQEHISSKMVSNLLEIQSRGARMFLIVKEALVQKLQQLDPSTMIVVPNTNDLFMPSIACIPLQILAYYIGVIKGNEIDKPRNLAKCVTVE